VQRNLDANFNLCSTIGLRNYLEPVTGKSGDKVQQIFMSFGSIYSVVLELVNPNSAVTYCHLNLYTNPTNN
jgi:hypothetical protein